MADEPLTPAAQATALVRSALEDVDEPTVRLSALIRKAVRIARLRNDYAALLWLDMEMRPIEDTETKQRIVNEIAPHFTRDEYERVAEETVKAYITERTFAKNKMLGLSVPEAEATGDSMEQAAASVLKLPEGMHPVDLFFENQRLEEARVKLTVAGQERNLVFARIRQRVADFLSRTERQLLYGQVNSDIFERNREYVDAQLRKLAPEALEQFAAAYRREGEGDPESRSHSLTSCRRVLKTVADALCPATNKTVVGVDDVSRKLTDDKFITRLCHFASEKARGSASGELLQSQIEGLGKHLDALNGSEQQGGSLRRVAR